MRTHRRTARLIAILFLASTAAYIVGTGLIDALLATPNDILHSSESRSQLIGGVLLQFVNCAAVVIIGVLFFPIVRRQSEPIGLGYVGARILESTFLVIGGIATLSVFGVSQAAIQAGTLEAAGALELSALLVEGRRTAYHVAMIALSLGSLPFCAVLYRSRLIPRPLSILGLIGYTSLLIGSVLELFGLDMRLLHNLPGGIFELTLPIWLLVKGFNPAAIAFETSQTEPQEREIGRIAEA